MSKRINEMNELKDMGSFPIAIYVGASANILFTIFLTHRVFIWSAGEWGYAIPWAVLIPLLNVAPVVLLRTRDKGERQYPEISQTRFVLDQHRFSSWVYAVAAANMFFWIIFSWWVFSLNAGLITLVILQLFACAATFVPLWRKYHPSFRAGP